MADNRLGNLRRSAAVMTFGPGSIVDFRADDGAVSAVAAGLEEWDSSFPPAGLANPQRIAEPRLQRKLSVNGFRLPPVVDENWRGDDGKPDRRYLVAARFPQWLQCPQCDRIGPARQWNENPGRAYRYCAKCTAAAPGQKKIFVIPVRFVMACQGGHLDEFPWHYWVAHRQGCTATSRGFLTLKAEKPGLAGIILSCPTCGARKSMDGIFSERTWKGFKCKGKRPWLPGADENCDRTPRTLQRGASNMYFPVIESALSIPPWSDALQEALGVYWSDIVNTEPDDRAGFIRMLARGSLKPILDDLGLTAEQLAAQIEERLRVYNDGATHDIRQEEYRQFSSGQDTKRDDAREFEVRNVPVPQPIRSFIASVVRAVRLREVRAIRGFTRINPPGDPASPDIAPLSATPKDWLPAVEVRGEGIFLALDSARLSAWEASETVRQRASRIDTAWCAAWHERHGDSDPPWRVAPRFVLVHTFAHALIRQLTLDCGYSSAALRERLYVDAGPSPMAGVLIYTATSDSDGTLGGLQRQGDAVRIGRVVTAAVQAMEWCSSDPLCIESMIAAPESMSLSACHACVLAAETACEHFNRFLDRAFLVGLADEPEVGFFAPLLRTT
jgi:hypothetical protein